MTTLSSADLKVKGKHPFFFIEVIKYFVVHFEKRISSVQPLVLSSSSIKASEALTSLRTFKLKRLSPVSCRGTEKETSF